MSKKIIGIKQADGSFFPILKDGEPASKTLELTTVRDGQTAVKINLYKQYEDTEELEYVDTLLIENLVPHLKEEPSFKLSINLDEDNILAAGVLDPETGAKSDTSVSLVTLSEAQLGETSDFTLADDTDLFDDIGTSALDASDDFSSLAEFEDEVIEKNVIDDDSDSLSDDVFNLDDTDFNLSDSIGGEETTENNFMEEESNSLDQYMMDDDFDFPKNEDITDDFSPENISEETEKEDNSFSMDDNFDFGDTSLDEDIFSQKESIDINTDTLNMSGDDLSFPEEETLAKEDIPGSSEIDDFEFPENTKLHDDLIHDDDFSSLGDITDDFSADSFNLDNDSSLDLGADSLDIGDDTFATESLDMGDDDFATESLDMGDDDFATESLDMGDDDFSTESLDMGGDGFETDSFDIGEEPFTGDSLDLGDVSDSSAIDFNEDFDLDTNETISMGSSKDTLGEDFDIGFGESDDSPFASLETNDNVQYAEYGTQNTTKDEDASTSFIPPLYDKKLKEDIEKRRSRKKYSLPMIICILCALICIVAVILAFAFGSWPGENPSVVNNVVTVEPPQVFEQERMESIKEGEATISPTPEENTIEVIIEKEVVPVKPAPSPDVERDSIDYLLIWGDTLWDLSDTYYRNPWLYNTIADANDIEDPDYIIAGTYIEIPSR